MNQDRIIFEAQIRALVSAAAQTGAATLSVIAPASDHASVSLGGAQFDRLVALGATVTEHHGDDCDFLQAAMRVGDVEVYAIRLVGHA